MRLAICNELFEGWTWQAVCEYVAAVGYTGLEVAPFTLGQHPAEIPAATLHQWRESAERAGLTVVGLHWLLARTTGFHLTSPDAQIRATTARYLGELARICSELGGTIMVFGSPAQRSFQADQTHAEAEELAVETIRRSLDALQRYQVVLALEPLGPAETNFINTAASGRELIRRIDSPWVRLHLDVKAMSSESLSFGEIISESRNELVHFHANDPNRLGPGMGKVDFAEIIPALRQIDYRGWLSVEVFDFSPGPREIAERSFQYLSAHLA